MVAKDRERLSIFPIQFGDWELTSPVFFFSSPFRAGTARLYEKDKDGGDGGYERDIHHTELSLAMGGTSHGLERSDLNVNFIYFSGVLRG